MTWTRLPFSSMSWSPSETHPLEHKKTIAANRAVLLRFEPGFADPKWCERSHLIYVVEGELTLELGAETLLLARGDALALDADTPHRAANPGPVPVVLFVVSDL